MNTSGVTDLERWLAVQARTLGLDALNVERADPDVLREYCLLVLNELAARGLLTGAHDVGCYAQVRECRN